MTLTVPKTEDDPTQWDAAIDACIGAALDCARGCQYDLGFDREIGPLGCRLEADKGCVCSGVFGTILELKRYPAPVSKEQAPQSASISRAELEAENVRLREALSYYADQDCWARIVVPSSGSHAEYDIEDDFWKWTGDSDPTYTARTALSSKGEGQP